MNPNVGALPHTLYRFYNAAGDLLYVGITFSPAERWSTHRRERPWWFEVATITVEHFGSRSAVEEAEILAIGAERPRYNTKHHPDRVAKVDCGVARQAIRYPSQDWKLFMTLAEPSGAQVLRDYLDWQIGKPGARRPARPSAERVDAVRSGGS